MTRGDPIRVLSGVLLPHQHAIAASLASMACNKDAATHRREGHVQTAHAGVLEVRVELRFLLFTIIRLIFAADGLGVRYFQGIRIHWFWW